MTNNSSEQEFLNEIFKNVPTVKAAGKIEFRAYYDPATLKILHFSQENLDLPYCVIKEEWYNTFRPDLYQIVNDEVCPRDSNFLNKNRLKVGSKFATIKGDMQFAVGNSNIDDCDYWDKND